MVEDLFDYFSIARNTLHSSKLVHPKASNSISSINSDLTVVDHVRLSGLRRTDSSVSAETLIDERLTKTTPVKSVLPVSSENPVNTVNSLSTASSDRSPYGMGKNLMNLTLKVKESKNSDENSEISPLDGRNMGSVQPGTQFSARPVPVNTANLLSRVNSTPSLFAALANE